MFFILHNKLFFFEGYFIISASTKLGNKLQLIFSISIKSMSPKNFNDVILRLYSEIFLLNVPYTTVVFLFNILLIKPTYFQSLFLFVEYSTSTISPSKA